MLCACPAIFARGAMDVIGAISSPVSAGSDRSSSISYALVMREQVVWLRPLSRTDLIHGNLTVPFVVRLSWRAAFTGNSLDRPRSLEVRFSFVQSWVRRRSCRKGGRRWTHRIISAVASVSSTTVPP